MSQPRFRSFVADIKKDFPTFDQFTKEKQIKDKKKEKSVSPSRKKNLLLSMREDKNAFLPDER